MERIAAIIGAGLIGRAWAVVFARAGWTVRLFDAVPVTAGPMPGGGFEVRAVLPTADIAAADGADGQRR